jgi:AraC family transcriptional regulator of adaptative response/methylated-DNA-[protein]-cysteine methyltransferase
VERNASYQLVEEAIRYLDANYQGQPELEELANALHVSKYHLQRVFTNWVGVSPKRFLQYTTLSHAKRLLAESQGTLETTGAVGLSSPSRLYDLFVKLEGITPGEYQRIGEEVSISYGFHPSPFGECLLGVTERGICHLSFVLRGRTASLRELREQWPRSFLREGEALTGKLVAEAFAGGKLDLFVMGTNFQFRVWEALLRIPAGTLVTYGELAQAVGQPGAARAVGRALASNPVGVLIPCHRVIKQTGAFHGYRWGVARKRALIAWETVRERQKRKELL